MEAVTRFPDIVNVCVLRGACNARCVHCPVGLTPPSEREKHFGQSEMSRDLFQRIVDEVAQHKHSSVRVHAVGEPLLWRPLPEVLAYASRVGVQTWIFTNGLAPNRDVLAAVIERATIVEISVNSVDRMDYLKTKGVDAFDVVYENIVFASTVAARSGTRLIVSRVQTRDPEMDSEFERFWTSSGLVSRAFVRSYHNYLGVLDGAEALPARRESGPCRVHWHRLSVDCDGKVVMCFSELFRGPNPRNDVILGDVTKSSLTAVWDGDALTAIRSAQVRGESSVGGRALPCATCSYRSSLGTIQETSEAQLIQLRVPHAQ